MRDSEEILLGSLNQTAKKIERYFIVLCSLSLYSCVIIFYDGDKIIEWGIITITTSETWHFVIGTIVLVLFGITGSQIINYMVKRFAFEKLIFDLDPERKKIRYDLLPHNMYEVMYEYFLGAQLIGARLNDDARRVVVILMYTLLHVTSLCAILNFYLLAHTWFFIDCEISWGIFGLILTLIVFCVIVLLWRSFFETLERRRKEWEKWKESKEWKGPAQNTSPKTIKKFKVDFISLGFMKFWQVVVRNKKY